MAAAPDVPHMTPEEFRTLGHRMVDRIAEYWKNIEQYPVLSKAKPGETAAKLPAHAPEMGLKNAAAWDAIFDDIESIVMPGITHWQHPNFYAYFPANISGPAVLGELLSAGLGVQGMLWATSPACTEIETRVLDWLGEMVGLPESFLSRSGTGGGVIQGTASEAVLAAMVAARRRVTGGTTENASSLVAYTSSQAHSSILKAAMVAGVASGPEDRVHVRMIEVNERFEMRTDMLEAAMREDLAAGRKPFFVCAAVGTTGSTAIDSIADIARIIKTVSATSPPRHSAMFPPPWLHVDAAHAGAACICPEFQHWLDGIENADSFCFNPH
jgi:aromatic-L-amino-acid decarboxylase